MPAKIPNIDATRCSGCGRCIAACQLGLFAFERQGWRKVSVLQDRDSCTGCAKCDAMCPIGAISMEKIGSHCVSGNPARNRRPALPMQPPVLPSNL